MRLVALFVALISFALPSLAKPELKALSTPDDLKTLYRAGEKYTIQLEYKDADGYAIKSARFVDRSQTNAPPFDAKDISGKAENGIRLVWENIEFIKGDHNAYFEVENEKGTKVRYPSNENAYYSFAVESLTDKWIVFIVGVVICIAMLPFLVYLIARSINKQGNPSSAARGALILGIFAALALFIWQFLSWYNPLVLVLGGVAALFFLVIVLARR